MFRYVQTTRCASSPRSKSGFTLIEILLSTLLFSIVLGSAVLIVQSLITSQVRTRGAVVVEQNLRFAISRISQRMASARTVTAPASGEASSLTLAMATPAIDPTIITVTNGVITIAEGSSLPLALTSNEILVTNLTFIRLPGSPAAIHIHLAGELRNATGAFRSPISLEDTVIIRR